MSRFQMPILHRSRKARKSSLRLPRNSGWKDDDGRLKIQAEFENFDADLYLSRMEEQSYLHCWDRLPSEFPEKLT